MLEIISEIKVLAFFFIDEDVYGDSKNKFSAIQGRNINMIVRCVKAQGPFVRDSRVSRGLKIRM